MQRMMDPLAERFLIIFDDEDSEFTQNLKNFKSREWRFMPIKEFMKIISGGMDENQFFKYAYQRQEEEQQTSVLYDDNVEDLMRRPEINQVTLSKNVTNRKKKITFNS